MQATEEGLRVSGPRQGERSTRAGLEIRGGWFNGKLSRRTVMAAAAGSDNASTG